MDSPELVQDRHGWLLEQLEQEGRVMTNQAASELAVSVDTVRRDLRNLHDRGLLRRVHGGAMRLSVLPDSFTGRAALESTPRSALAGAVVNRFRAGQVVGLDAGSTNVEVAAQIPQSFEITIVTNSPAVALALANHRSATALLIGGTVDLTWMATTGSATVDAWRMLNLDLAVLGVCGFDAERGASTRSVAEVATKRALAAAAAETIIPVQAEKLDTNAPFHVLDAEQVDTLVLPRNAAKAAIDRYQDQGIDVVIA